MRKGVLYTVTYDVPDDRRRVKIANLLKSYGERVQLSVFECWLNASEVEALKQRLERVMEPSEDSVRIYSVRGAVQVLGVGKITEEENAFIV
ncbi:CRISPR-associated endonuclease Cas2 [Marinithermus hydrothermalis]|uniref:CRISPR-associated endoribonuclease Cas2 n=1 Tax=Marinithermus hydrothermalis (strain DSM 14884 / JCM 11576 / T1) TaxID=869210 RepID=F2NNA9_MARHT|nr:CRISPR-associated endonuclease Cas2 [Marinithermus hydrothermalis]AEB10950.1 CRISPR-associated protein Cas2 [Marinithermus hydrothermalis DSM 14884]